MSQDFQPGDFLIFQLEAGYGLLRLLGTTLHRGQKIWHLASYEDLFIDVESIEESLNNIDALKLGESHIALTNRAFESTQVARIKNTALTADEEAILNDWRASDPDNVSDRSVRLMLGLR